IGDVEPSLDPSAHGAFRYHALFYGNTTVACNWASARDDFCPVALEPLWRWRESMDWLARRSHIPTRGGRIGHRPDRAVDTVWTCRVFALPSPAEELPRWRIPI